VGVCGVILGEGALSSTQGVVVLIFSGQGGIVFSSGWLVLTCFWGEGNCLPREVGELTSYGGGGTVFTGGRGYRFLGGGSELTCSVARGYYHLGMEVLTCLEGEGTKVSETFSDRKLI
jgi:hypothetical protein